MARYSDCPPSAWFGLATSLEVIGWPELIATSGTIPVTEVASVKYTLGKVAATEIVDVFRSAEVIGTRGSMSLAATTTDDWELLLVAVAVDGMNTEATGY